MKKISRGTIFAIFVALMAFSPVNLFANVPIELDGEVFESSAIIINDRTFLPIDEAAELLGIEIPEEFIGEEDSVAIRFIAEYLGFYVDFIDGVVVLKSPAAGHIHGAIHRVEYGGNVAYIFGTLHAAISEWFPLADIVEDAMQRADIFVFEVDLSFESYSDEDIQAITNLALLPNDTTIADFLTEDELISFEQNMKNLDISFEWAQHISPSILSYTISFLFFDEDVETEFDQSVDSYILDFAFENSRSVIGLVDMYAQESILARPPYEIMQAYARRLTLPFEEMSLALAETHEVDWSNLAELYYAQDLEGINALYAVFADIDPDDIIAAYMQEVVMNQRSAEFARQIIRLLQYTEEPTTFFVAIGIAHLTVYFEGRINTIMYLEQAGFNPAPLFE